MRNAATLRSPTRRNVGPLRSHNGQRPRVSRNGEDLRHAVVRWKRKERRMFDRSPVAVSEKSSTQMCHGIVVVVAVGTSTAFRSDVAIRVLDHRATESGSRNFSRKPQVLSSERGSARTGSSSFPPQVDVISVPFRTGQPGCSCSSPADCAGEKGRTPGVQPEEPEPELLQQLVLASAELLPEQRLQSYRSHCHIRQPHSRSSSSSPCRSSRQQPGIRKPSEPVLLRVEHRGRSQPAHMSELTRRRVSSSSDCDEPGHRSRQQLPSGRVRQSRSDRRRRRS